MESGGGGFIEVKVISGKNLKAFNFFQKLSVYAVVSIVSDSDDDVDKKDKVDEQQQQHRTPTDREGDGNPEWNHTIRLELSNDDNNMMRRFVQFELRHEGAMFGDKTIGEVRVPIRDLIQESINGALRYVIYEVRTTDGKSNGVLNFSFQVHIPNQNANQYGNGRNDPPQITTGYPPTLSHHHQHQHNASSDVFQFCSSQVENESSPRIQYPVLELEDDDDDDGMLQQQHQQYSHSHSHRPQLIHSSSGNQDPPPPPHPAPAPPYYFGSPSQQQNAYYQYQLPPPSPPPPHLMAPPPPPRTHPPPSLLLGHGPCYHPPPPPPAGPNNNNNPWGPPSHYVGGHGHGHGPQMGSGGDGQYETWPNSWHGLGLGTHHSSSWNGRY